MDEKVTMGPQTWVYPMHAWIVGVNVNGKPNFMTIAWGGIASGDPPMIAVSIEPAHYSYLGIKQTGTFSVNVPSAGQISETDYCGLISGSKTDKAKDCKFDIFYGKLGNAPLIGQCPINLECKVAHTLELGNMSFIIAKIEETHISRNCLTNGKPDVNKLKPLVYTEPNPHQYHSLGEVIGKAFDIGKR